MKLRTGKTAEAESRTTSIWQTFLAATLWRWFHGKPEEQTVYDLRNLPESEPLSRADIEARQREGRVAEIRE